MKKDILKLGLILALFAVGACVALAMVHTVTRPTIEGHEARNLEASLKEIFPEAEAFESLDGAIDSGLPGVAITGAWKASKGGATLGLAIRTRGKSYSGEAAMLVGVRTDRRLSGVRILSLSDTPGLGANAMNPTYFVEKSSKTTFPGQFKDKPVSDPFEVKNDVSAITASTITSKALTDMAKAAALAGAAWLEKAAAGGL